MLYQIMFQRAVPGFEPSDQAYEVAVQAFGTLVNATRRAMAAGVIAEGPLTDTAQILWASVHGWVSLELLGIGFVEDQDSAFERAHTALLRGLRP
jgi:hypothetical protein